MCGGAPRWESVVVRVSPCGCGEWGKEGRECGAEDGQRSDVWRQMWGFACACVTFGNAVILIPHLGLSRGLRRDYSSRPIITWETKGEAQCHNSDQQTEMWRDRHAVTWDVTGPAYGQNYVELAACHLRLATLKSWARVGSVVAVNASDTCQS